MKDPQHPPRNPDPAAPILPAQPADLPTTDPALTNFENLSPQALSDAVDALAYPMMALQADASLLHANKAALDVLTAGQVFVLSAAGQVVPKPASWRAEFAAAMQMAAGGQIQRLNWAEGKLIVHASLRSLGCAAGKAGPACVLLMMAPPMDAVFDLSGFAATHKLSGAETRVLEALLHGNQAEDTSKRLDVGVATVRSQIASIRKKTGHDNVASLLAALGDLPPLRRAETPPLAARVRRSGAAAGLGTGPRPKRSAPKSAAGE